MTQARDSKSVSVNRCAVVLEFILALALVALVLSCSRDSGLDTVEQIDGNKRMVGTMKDGKKHGKWTTWFDGEVFEVEHWRDGKRHGPYHVWLDDKGPMTADGSYFDDMPHGRTRIFNAPGRLSELGWYSHGRRERTWCAWEPDGSLEYIRVYQEDRLMREDKSPPGQCPLIFGEGKRHLDPANTDYGD